MSWSKSTSGTAEEILNAAANWPGQIDQVDRTYGTSEELRAGHRRQANAALGAITEFITEVPENRTFSVVASGHANDNGTGNVSVSIAELVVAKEEPAAEIAGASADSTADAGAGSGGVPSEG